jgi:hypothetical protein
MLIQTAEPSRVANIIETYIAGSVTSDTSIIPPLIVFTTSPPAIIAPLASNIAAIIIAQPIVIAFEPTAGPILLATSFAPMFMAR